MLKKIFINGKKIPVPIPIKTLVEAGHWIEKHLVRQDHVITRIVLDGQDVEFDGAQPMALPSLELKDESDLRIKIDSPLDICVQTIDALRNLSTVISRNLKPIAVLLWEYRGSTLPPEARTVMDDAGLMLELLDHILVLVDKRVESRNVFLLKESISKAFSLIKLAESQSDWRGFAKILLQKLEELTMDLSAELSSLQKSIFEIQADRNIDRRSNAVSR